MENAKIHAIRRMYRAERIPSAMLSIIDLCACVPMDSRENRMSNAPDIPVIKTMTARPTKNAVPTKCAGILVWNKELVEPTLNAESRTEWPIVPVRLDITETLNSNANRVNIHIILYNIYNIDKHIV